MRAIATSLIFLLLVLVMPAHAFAGTLRQPHFGDPCGCQPIAPHGWGSPQRLERVVSIASGPCQPAPPSRVVAWECCAPAVVHGPAVVRRQPLTPARAIAPGPAVTHRSAVGGGSAVSAWQSAPLAAAAPLSAPWGASSNWDTGSNWGQGIGGVSDATGLGWNGAIGGLWPGGEAAPRQVLDLRNMPNLLQNVASTGTSGAGQGGVLMLSWELTDTNVAAGMAGGLDAPLGGLMGGGELGQTLNGGGGGNLAAASGLGLGDLFPGNSLFSSNSRGGFSGGSPGAGFPGSGLPGGGEGPGGGFPGGGSGVPGGGGGPPSGPPSPPPPYFPEPPFPLPVPPEPGPLPPGPSPVVAPEPSTLLIFALGALALAVTQVRRRQTAGQAALGCSG